MSFSRKKLILNVLAIVLVAIFVVFQNFFQTTKLGITLLVLLLISYAILCLIWNRCPHCNVYLRKMAFFAKHCPFCGEKLE